MGRCGLTFLRGEGAGGRPSEKARSPEEVMREVKKI